MAFTPTIGLEIHAELATRTKMFCTCANDPDESRPNVNVCPICLAHPGTLPVPNKEAIRHILRLGAAVDGMLADYTEFDRKSYFYPDIPKGYQISQYEHPLVSGGALAGVALTRVHLEEDTARSSHERGKTLVDFNRAGIPLMELVTEPVIRDAETAGRFARELQLLLRTLGAGDANLEKGEMRIEANVSVSAQEGTFGTKVEVKNLNSFRSVERAIAYEIERQSKLIEEGGVVEQETRGWDESKQHTFRQRVKEGSADYRYFPEPDIPPLVLSELPDFSPEVLRSSLPELPWNRRARYRALGLAPSATEVLMQDEFLGAMFDGAAAQDADAKILALASNYIVSDIRGLLQDTNARGKASNLTVSGLLALMHMLAENRLSSRGAKDVLARMYADGGDPETIAQDARLLQVSDAAALAVFVDDVLVREAAAVEEYRKGKPTALEYLVGQAMKESRGSGNPQAFRSLFIEKLSQD